MVPMLQNLIAQTNVTSSSAGSLLASNELLLVLIGLASLIVGLIGVVVLLRWFPRAKIEITPILINDLKYNKLRMIGSEIDPNSPMRRTDYAVTVRNNGKLTLQSVTAMASYRLPSGYFLSEAGSEQPLMKIGPPRSETPHRQDLDWVSGPKSEKVVNIQPENEFLLILLAIMREDKDFRIISNGSSEIFPSGTRKTQPEVFEKPLKYSFFYGTDDGSQSEFRIDDRWTSDLTIRINVVIRGTYNGREISRKKSYALWMPKIGTSSFDLHNGRFGEVKKR